MYENIVRRVNVKSVLNFVRFYDRVTVYSRNYYFSPSVNLFSTCDGSFNLTIYSIKKVRRKYCAIQTICSSLNFSAIKSLVNTRDLRITRIYRRVKIYLAFRETRPADGDTVASLFPFQRHNSFPSDSLVSSGTVHTD